MIAIASEKRVMSGHDNRAGLARIAAMTLPFSDDPRI